MDEYRRAHVLFLVLFMSVLCAGTALITAWAIRSAETIHAKQTYDEILKIKKSYLKDSVTNMIRTLDRVRAFNTDLARMGAAKPGTESEWAEERSKRAIATLIRDQTFADGGYIWVNEVLDWKGGDEYAIRRVHPALPHTEGILLSTELKDLRGNRPYLTELEGVRDKGEVFFTYFFKRPDSTLIGEKITYATVYPDYNWIIAMGVYLEDLQVYVDAAHRESARLTDPIMIVALSIMVLLFAVSLIVLARKERSFLALTSRRIREESNVDHLTGASNRRIGDSILHGAFMAFRKRSVPAVLYMLDIDDFKAINDSQGHAAGDEVLRALSAGLRSVIRTDDRIIRWGGEEFLIVCPGTLASEGQFADRILECVRSIQVDFEGKTIRFTVSVGVSWFSPEDRRPGDAVERADTALYQAKADGKNRARIEQPPR